MPFFQTPVLIKATPFVRYHKGARWRRWAPLDFRPMGGFVLAFAEAGVRPNVYRYSRILIFIQAWFEDVRPKERVTLPVPVELFKQRDLDLDPDFRSTYDLHAVKF